jgi:integrase
MDWLESIERDEHTMETITGQAKNWIYPRIGKKKIKDFSATDTDRFFQQIASFLSKRSLVMIKSTLRRSIRRAQVHDLIGRNVASESGQLACCTKPQTKATITEVSREIKETTCRSCRSQIGIDDTEDDNRRLEALFVLSITLGLRPGELRKLTSDHVDLNRAVIHVWRSASKTGETKTPKSKRSLILPKHAIAL